MRYWTRCSGCNREGGSTGQCSEGGEIPDGVTREAEGQASINRRRKVYLK